jgi:UDP-N-acetylglucosamine 4,6-dehydratase
MAAASPSCTIPLYPEGSAGDCEAMTISLLEKSNILITGGAGTLGHALAARRKKEGWTGRLTVYSTDTLKHEKMRHEFPDIQFVQGDIRTGETLYNAMVGHDVVIHAAAVKVIPASEYNSIDTFDVNVNGSRNVCMCAITANIKHVLGISTDKACHPANAYGASKLMMEKIFQEYARQSFETEFHLVRYGNVLESNGSVINAWRNSIEIGEPIKVTNPKMTRFWLSPNQAVDCLTEAFNVPSGWIYIPKLPALSIGKLVAYTIGEDHPWVEIPLRPGEKIHETLLTIEEGFQTVSIQNYYLLGPSTFPQVKDAIPPFSSDTAEELLQTELIPLLANG